MRPHDMIMLKESEKVSGYVGQWCSVSSMFARPTREATAETENKKVLGQTVDVYLCKSTILMFL